MRFEWFQLRADINDNYGISFQGTCLVIVSPTMLDIAAYVGVGLAEIAAMLLVRSVGSVVGSVGAGILFDKFYKYSLWIIVNFIIFGGMCKFACHM